MLKPGDSVEFTAAAKQQFPKARITTGTYAGPSQFSEDLICVKRASQKSAETWHRKYWQPSLTTEE